MRSRSFSLALLVLPVLSGLVVACSSTSSPDPDAQVREACSKRIAARQEADRRCGGDTVVPQRETDRFVLACTKGATAPGTSESVTSVSECAAKIQSATCAVYLEGALCVAAAGALPTGAPCGTSSQCASTGCDRVEPALCGTCGPRLAAGAKCTERDRCVATAVCRPQPTGSSLCVEIKTVGEGEACGVAELACEAGLACIASTKKCVKRGAVGAKCDLENTCAAGLVCRAAVCSERLAEGAACDFKLNLDCRGGLVCDPAVSKCVALKRAKGGEPCDGITACERGATYKACYKGKCPAILAEGAPCVAEDAAAICDIGAACLAGKCTLDDPGACK